MGNILQSSDYGSIRAKLGVDTNDLPDADIDTIGLLPVAEAMIASLITDYVTILAGTGNNKTFLQAAALSLCAALACGKLEVQRGQSFKRGDYSESEVKADWSAKREELLCETKGYLMRITTHTHTQRTLFAVSGPTSSGNNYPDRVQRWYARITPMISNWLDENGLPRYSWSYNP